MSELQQKIQQLEFSVNTLKNIERLLKEASWPGSQAYVVAEAIQFANSNMKGLQGEIRKIKSGDLSALESSEPISEGEVKSEQASA